jgi:aminoglycoside phosphotransferase (APT) family kinase protein
VVISLGERTWRDNRRASRAAPVPESFDAEAWLADEAALRDLLRGCEATQALADGRLSPVAGGLSNRAWRLEARDGTWFVRRAHPDAARFGVDRRSECMVLHTVAAAGLAPLAERREVLRQEQGAPVAGVLTRIAAPAGATVKVGALLCVIE